MGMFDEAGIDINTDVPNDPYGFGKDYWPVEIVKADAPDVSKGGKQYGTMLRWKCLAPQYSYMESLGYGNWLQVPPPLEVVKIVPELAFDKESEQGKKCIYILTTLLKGMGIPQDKWNSIKIPELLGMRCMAKIFVKQNEEGFWQFNITAHKPMPEEGSAEAMSVFAAAGNAAAPAPANGGSLSALEQALADEEAAKSDAK